MKVFGRGKFGVSRPLRAWGLAAFKGLGFGGLFRAWGLEAFKGFWGSEAFKGLGFGGL